MLSRRKRNIISMSLSARRAWIEIEEQIEQETAPESLSARRAWIEIYLPIE